MQAHPQNPDEPSGDPWATLEPNAEEFAVTLTGGGGPGPFHAALARKFRSVIRHGCRCVILTPTLHPARYVQAILTPAGIRIESVGQHYLTLAGDELTAEQLARLGALGWLEPLSEHEDPDARWPRNWWFELSGEAVAERAAGWLLATLIEVHGLLDIEPVEISILSATNDTYRWEPDPDHPCGGHLEPVADPQAA